MNSSLYECRLLHHRFAPKEHLFRNRLYFFCLDLDELAPIEAALVLFSRNRPNLYEFRDKDYLPISEAGAEKNESSELPLRSRLTAYLAFRGFTTPPGKILLVTIPRIAGYHFNPVSFYYCYDRNGVPLCAVAEVTNTFREVKPYLLPPSALNDRGFAIRLPKFFYVSPFARTDGEFHFDLGLPGEELVCRINEYEDNRLKLHTVLTGVRQDLNDAKLAWFALKYPVMGLQVLLQIHLKAFKLYRMQVPFFRKAENPESQKGLYRPHRSLVGAGPPPGSPLRRQPESSVKQGPL